MKRMLSHSLGILLLLLKVTSANPVFAQQGYPARDLTPARVGVSYTYQLQASGGSPPLRWSLVDGLLPHNLFLNSSGRIFGTPDLSQSEPYRFTVELSDSSPIPQRFQMRLSIAVSGSMYIVAPGSVNATGPGAAAAASPTPEKSNSDKVSIAVDVSSESVAWVYCWST
jgi:hypothetical protein